MTNVAEQTKVIEYYTDDEFGGTEVYGANGRAYYTPTRNTKTWWKKDYTIITNDGKSMGDMNVDYADMMKVIEAMIA